MKERWQQLTKVQKGTVLTLAALAVIFAVTLILTYAGGFNMVASYNLQSTFSAYSFYDPKTTPLIIGAILALLVGSVAGMALLGLLKSKRPDGTVEEAP